MPRQLRNVRDFFNNISDDIDIIVDKTFKQIMQMYPDTKNMFSKSMKTHQHVFSSIFRKMIELTRSAHLWPASVQTGKAILPGLDDIRTRHEEVGVTGAHFEGMKTALLLALQNTFPSDFTPDVREGFIFVFDAMTKSLINTARDDAALAHQLLLE